jgi:hypothetical protein
MDKTIANEIREDRWKEKQENKLKRVAYVGSVMDWIAQIIIEK